MKDQETNFLNQLQDEDSICRSMLNLSTVSDHQSSSAADGSLDPCPTTCVCSAKLQFPLSRSLMVQEPAPKRATLHPPSSPSTATAEAQDQVLFGYKKLQLPPGFVSASPPPLRRTLSEPIYSPGTVHSAAPPPQLPELLTSPPPIKTHLSTVSDHQSPSAADGSLDPYPTTCVCSAKRQFPLSRSLMVQESASKRATLHPPSSPSTATAEAQDQDLFGYKKLQLPPGFISASPPPLRRTLSEPIYSPGTVYSAAPPPQLPELLTSPPPIKTQPRYPNLAFNRQVVAAARTPPRPPARRNASRSPSFGESPNARRLRRMKEQLREMSQWANQVSNNADEGEETVESSHRCSDTKDESEDLPQEAVFVEKSGDCLVLHFRCPCGNGYQILLSGNNCYYKLTSLRK